MTSFHVLELPFSSRSTPFAIFVKIALLHWKWYKKMVPCERIFLLENCIKLPFFSTSPPRGDAKFLRHSSPPLRATDFILRPPLSSLCDYFACCSLPLRYADFLQNFCSAEICTTSLHKQGRDLFVHSLFHIFLEKRHFWPARGKLQESVQK